MPDGDFFCFFLVFMAVLAAKRLLPVAVSAFSGLLRLYWLFEAMQCAVCRFAVGGVQVCSGRMRCLGRRGCCHVLWWPVAVSAVIVG